METFKPMRYLIFTSVLICWTLQLNAQLSIHTGMDVGVASTLQANPYSRGQYLSFKDVEIPRPRLHARLEYSFNEQFQLAALFRYQHRQPDIYIWTDLSSDWYSVGLQPQFTLIDFENSSFKLQLASPFEFIWQNTDWTFTHDENAAWGIAGDSVSAVDFNTALRLGISPRLRYESSDSPWIFSISATHYVHRLLKAERDYRYNYTNDPQIDNTDFVLSKGALEFSFSLGYRLGFFKTNSTKNQRK